MPNVREVRNRIRSVKNIAQVTRALQAVSASKVRKAEAAVKATRPYATKAWDVLTHIAAQPGRENLHPLLLRRERVNSILVLMITGDRGLAGPYTTNVLRFTLERFRNFPVPVRYVAVGRKGRDLLLRRQLSVMAEFSNLPPDPEYGDVSQIGRLAVEEFLEGHSDEVYIVYTDFITLVRQQVVVKKLLPLEIGAEERVMAYGVTSGPTAAFIYEPDQLSILNEIIPRFTALQVYQAILESSASEHAARMVAMRNATESATELADILQLQYNNARQQAITSEIIDIVGGSEAQAI